jgi:hypothetical protein
VLTTWLLARFLGNRQGWALLYRACPAVALGIVVLVDLRRWAKPATKALKGNCRFLSAATLETTLQLELLRAVQALDSGCRCNGFGWLG